jgi:hypothetical protein
MSRKHILWLSLYQYAAGLCDTCTGLLLVFVPGWTLRLMRIGVAPQPIEFASFIGIFVLGVGLTYLWFPITLQRPAAPIHSQWRITALVRTLVAIFLLSEVFSGKMEFGWIVVALSDGTLALIQWFGLLRGWLSVVE